MEDEQLVQLTADIVAAHVSNNSVAVGDIGGLVQRVHAALTELGQPPAEDPPAAKTPAVSIRASVKPDYIVCLECGKRQKTLRRHLQSAHGLTPEEYRQGFGLAASYPMVSANYSAARREMAHSIGLGRKRTAKKASDRRKPKVAPE
jgi:predicted transcriptional regulator